MRLIKPSFSIIKQQAGEIGMYKHIETCGRVAWKSEERTTLDSHIKFLEMLKGVNHGSVLEHGTVYLKVKWYSLLTILFFFLNKYSKVKSWRYITTNYRVIVDNKKQKVMKYMVEPTEFHEKRATVNFICDRGVSHEYVRHRVFSFTQESTRYCNYTNEKFGNEITFIYPVWLKQYKDFVDGLVDLANKNNKKVYALGHDKSQPMEYRGLCSFIYDMSNSEHGYNFQISAGWKPQQARAILPNALKTELIMTGFESDWVHFLKLRCPKSAHPQARELAMPLCYELVDSFDNIRRNIDLKSLNLEDMHS